MCTKFQVFSLVIRGPALQPAVRLTWIRYCVNIKGVPHKFLHSEIGSIHLGDFWPPPLLAPEPLDKSTKA